MPEFVTARLYAMRNNPRVAQLLSRAATGFDVALQVFVPREKIASTDTSLAFANPNRLIAKGRFVTVVFIFGFFAWAGLAPLESALIAPGTIVVESHRKVLQHLEGGVVKDILVREGDVVRAGQKLLELDPTQASSTLDAVQGEVDALSAQEARLLAERQGAAVISFPRHLLERNGDLKVRQAIAGEIAAFETRRTSLAKQIDILRQRKNESIRAIASLEIQLHSAQDRARLLARESQSVEELYEKQLVTLQRLLQLQRDTVAANGERDALVEKIEQTRLEASSNDLQIAGLREQQQSDIAKELREVQTRRFEALERLRAANAVQGRTSLLSPVAGTVVGLAIHTKGAVIRAGDTVLEIVPRNDELLIEAHLRPEDADDVRPGQAAHINFSGYEQRTLPTLAGVVRVVSADRLTDPKTGSPYFSATVAVDREALKDYQDLEFMPGLPVDVAVDTGSRTFLQYLTRPITDVMWRGMRER